MKRTIHRTSDKAFWYMERDGHWIRLGPCAAMWGLLLQRHRRRAGIQVVLTILGVLALFSLGTLG